MRPWTRDDTREWIAQLEDRINDISEYLDKTLEWCENNYIRDERIVFICSFLTCIWVSQLSDEPITYVELMEMLGVPDPEPDEEKLYELGDQFLNLTHRELLESAVKTFNED